MAGNRRAARGRHLVEIAGVHRGLSPRRSEPATIPVAVASAPVSQTPEQAGSPAGRAPVSAGPRFRGYPARSWRSATKTELTRAAAVLDGVDRALERLSDGTYGQCETCGAPILDADLERDPTRRMCEQHLTLAQ